MTEVVWARSLLVSQAALELVQTRAAAATTTKNGGGEE